MSWREMLERLPHWMLGLALVVAVLLVAIQMFRGDALVCGNGAIFARKCDPVTAVDLPSGAVVAFAKEHGCPAGWTEYKEAEGRFIVGAGRHSEYNQYGNEVTMKYVGDTGGEDQVRLGIDHMPSHFHRNPSRGDDAQRRKIVWALQAARLGDYGGPDSRPTEATGGNKPHDNMPPFVALVYCQRD